MRAGRLDRRITIQRKTLQQSASGQATETWQALGANRFAAVEPLSGEERFSVPQYAARQQVTFLIRWASGVADLSPLDRVIYPAIQGDGQPPANSIYDIVEVHEVGRRESLNVKAVRRPDA